MNYLAACLYEVTVSLYGYFIFNKKGSSLSFKVENVESTEMNTEPGKVSQVVVRTAESEIPIKKTEEVLLEDEHPVQVEVVPEKGTNSTTLVNEELEAGEETKNEDMKKIIILLCMMAVEVPVGSLIGIALIKLFLKKNVKKITDSARTKCIKKKFIESINKNFILSIITKRIGIPLL